MQVNWCIGDSFITSPWMLQVPLRSIEPAFIRCPLSWQYFVWKHDSSVPWDCPRSCAFNLRGRCLADFLISLISCFCRKLGLSLGIAKQFSSGYRFCAANPNSFIEIKNSNAWIPPGWLWAMFSDVLPEPSSWPIYLIPDKAYLLLYFLLSTHPQGTMSGNPTGYKLYVVHTRLSHQVVQFWLRLRHCCKVIYRHFILTFFPFSFNFVFSNLFFRVTYVVKMFYVSLKIHRKANIKS